MKKTKELNWVRDSLHSSDLIVDPEDDEGGDGKPPYEWMTNKDEQRACNAHLEWTKLVCFVCTWRQSGYLWVSLGHLVSSFYG